MELNVLLLIIVVCGAAAATGDYVRPPPRATLSFPWSKKRSSEPQQVNFNSISSILKEKKNRFKLFSFSFFGHLGSRVFFKLYNVLLVFFLWSEKEDVYYFGFKDLCN